MKEFKYPAYVVAFGDEVESGTDLLELCKSLRICNDVVELAQTIEMCWEFEPGVLILDEIAIIGAETIKLAKHKLVDLDDTEG